MIVMCSCFARHKRFSEDREKVEADEYPGRPVIGVTEGKDLEQI